MCGICGVVQLSGQSGLPVTPEVLDRMTDIMTHRGPSDRGTYLAPGIALGARRLSIIDVQGGHQPVPNESERIWAIQNGELYNHVELRKELERDGHVLRTGCDTEVLPHLYERVGDAVPEALRGKFAIAIWDGGRRRALLARDRFGVKPLYIAEVRGLLIFASELKSVLASGLVDPKLDLDAIDAYLSLGFFAGDTTPLRHVRKLLPAHRAVVEDGGVRIERYYELPYPVGDSQASEPELSERLLAELEESVRLRLMSDVPLGSMLSGGLDSSVVTALMARQSTHPVKTFSVAFVEDARGNELSDARLVASALGADHHELELSFAEQSISLETLTWQIDEPLADVSALGFSAISSVAAQHVTVALSGQGADEVLGGYPAHRNAMLARHWQMVPSPLRTIGRHAVGVTPARYRRAASVVTEEDALRRLLMQTSKMTATQRRELLPGAPAIPAVEALASRWVRHRRGDPFAETLFAYQQYGLVDDMLAYNDKTSMAHSLEVRVPFLDHKVVEFCATLPPRFKVDRTLTGKTLLRRIARGLVPDRVIDKRKIGFFSHATEAWFAGQVRPQARHWLLRGDRSTRDLIDGRALERLVGDWYEGRGSRDSSSLVLAILMLEIWLSDTLPRALALPRDGYPPHRS